METRTYTERSNARRAARVAGVDPNLVYDTGDGFAFPPPDVNGDEPATITDDAWPHHSNGSRKTVGEMTTKQQVAVVTGAVARLMPEFAAQGIAVEFKGTIPPDCDDIPAFCKLSPEERKAAWDRNPPKAAPAKPKETQPMAKAKTKKADKASGTDKNATLLAMLKKGATVDALTKALDWLPHTLRARISRVGKPKGKGGEGLKVERSREDGVTSYRIAS